MKEYKDIQEFANDYFGKPIYNHMYEEALRVHGNISTFSDAPFEEFMGGNLYVIELKRDLEKIETSHSYVTIKEKISILDTPDAFDVCEYVAKGDYVQIMLCTNNDGGDTYLIPREIADKSPNILKSIQMTKTAWTNEE